LGTYQVADGSQPIVDNCYVRVVTGSIQDVIIQFEITSRARIQLVVERYGQDITGFDAQRWTHGASVVSRRQAVTNVGPLDSFQGFNEANIERYIQLSVDGREFRRLQQQAGRAA
jgi:hypothetical protein